MKGQDRGEGGAGREVTQNNTRRGENYLIQKIFLKDYIKNYNVLCNKRQPYLLPSGLGGGREE